MTRSRIDEACHKRLAGPKLSEQSGHAARRRTHATSTALHKRPILSGASPESAQCPFHKRNRLLRIKKMN